ncbi:hypothetical protein [Gracilimonas sediminicola]|uniref:ATP-grasp domain-containing protein n=1 Tax=Gracilimonas sediminicola TaxID=2952158 RepID=A0A9X2L0C3_9BACT|nr:hypothetical protein [Gracilimonas sediminicola]MCP9290001.1 hypothetical protein [Gracilimonas sediminicola]
MILKTWPDKVKPSSKIYQYIDGNETDPHGVYWNHDTISEIKLTRYCSANRGTWDVSKHRVMSIWEHVTRRPFEIDPTIHNGMAVEKSNEQYTHDGRTVDCPAEKVEGKVYQRFIDSSLNEYEFIEYRVFYHWGVDFVIEKVKEKANQWGWEAVEITFFEPNDVFSSKEINQIDEFCKVMDIQFTELDIMRDETGIYVIDVNNIAGNGSNVLASNPDAENRYKKAVKKLCGKE